MTTAAGPGDRPRVIVGVALVASEADIVETFVRHNLHFADRLIVGIHNAFDRTPEILGRLVDEGLPISLATIAGTDFDQRRLTTQLAALAVSRFAADWVLPLDADELIDCADREMLTAALCQLEDEGCHGLWPWKNHVATAADDPAETNPVRRLRHRYADSTSPITDPWSHKVLINVALWRRIPAEVRTGNHYLAEPGSDRPGSAPLRVVRVAALRHFPMRSAGQTIAKCAINHFATMAARAEQGLHQRKVVERIRSQGRLDATDLELMTRHYAQGNIRALSPQPIIEDPFTDRAGVTPEPGGDDPLPPILSWIERHLEASCQPSLAAQFDEFARGRSPDHVERADRPPLRLAFERVAIYLPQYHRCAENDRFWGEGFTDWTNVARALPRFAGHFQPRRPGALGYYDLEAAHVLPQQVAIARNYGISAFNFLFYWFGDRSLLETPIRRFLESPELELGFFLTWANENWTRRWNGQDQDVLLWQDYSTESTTRMIRHLLPYFRDRRYLRVGGRPLLAIYKPNLIPDLAGFRRACAAACAEAGIDRPYLVMALTDGNPDPRRIGFDAALEYPPHTASQPRARAPGEIGGSLHWFDPRQASAVCSYDSLVDSQLSVIPPAFRCFRTAFPSWDNTPRRPQGGGWTCHGSTPAAFARWLEAICRQELAADASASSGFRMVCVNAWNEWAEGAALEPDGYFGYAYLDACHRVFSRFAEGDSARPRTG